MKKSRKHKAAGIQPKGQGRLFIVTALVLTLIATTVILGQKGSNVPDQKRSRQKQTQSDDYAAASLLPSKPSKELIYAGGKLVSTEEPTAVNGDDAQFVSMSYREPCSNIPPPQSNWSPIGAGSFGDTDEEYSVRITMKNTGNNPWLPGTYFLGSQNPPNNPTWGPGKNKIPLP